MNKVWLPSTLENIGVNAFSGCTGIKELTIPDNVTDIGKGAFSGCTGIETLTCPGTYNYYHYYTEGVGGVFGGCSGIKQINLTGNGAMPQYGRQSGSSYKVMNQFTPWMIASNAGNEINVTVNEGLTSIGSGAFYNCEGLVQIDIADLDIAETTKTIDRDGYWAELEYLASYDIKGLVVALDDYDHKIGEVSAFDKAIPRDLSLTWGVSAQYSNKIKWSHGGRAVKWEYTPDLWQSRGLSEHDFINSISNNHLITDDKSIYRKIKRVRRGDYIEMKGYLVRGKITDKKTGYEYTFSSSLVRDDYTRNMLKDSSTSCEIIYLTSIEWLD